MTREIGETKFRKKVYIIGPYPPPYGGVSVYIYRYTKLLREMGFKVKNIDFYKFSNFKKLWFLFSLVFNPDNITYHVNSIHFSINLAFLLRIFPCEISYYAHSSLGLEELSGIRKKAFSLFLKRTDECVFVGELVKRDYQLRGFTFPTNSHIKPAFLPPPVDEELKIWNSYDEETKIFLLNRKPLIVANAFRITFYDNVDLYGIDLCIELTSLLKKEYPDLGFLFALAETGDQSYFSVLTKRIQNLKIEKNFYFLTGQKELWPIFRKAKLMIRPTYKDGFGISISEAQYLGCKTIASDVCIRPEGTILFRNRDIEDLVKKVEWCLNE